MGVFEEISPLLNLVLVLLIADGSRGVLTTCGALSSDTIR